MTFDVIVIGAGAGGLAAAYKLATAGKRVLIIEKGPAVRAGSSALGCGPLLFGVEHRSSELWQDPAGNLFLPDEFSNIGGKTKWYGGVLLRMIPREFQPEPSYRALGWPISYEEFSRHYQEAERLFCPIHFKNEAYLSDLITRICADAQWTCDALPMALKEDIINDEYHLKYFDGYVSARDYKRDAESVFLSHIENAQGCKLISGFEAKDLLYDDMQPERITGVVCSEWNYLAESSRHSCGRSNEIAFDPAALSFTSWRFWITPDRSAVQEAYDVNHPPGDTKGK